MRRLILSQEEKDVLMTMDAATHDKRVAERIKIIISLSEGESPQRLSKIFFTDVRTIQRYMKAYLEEGLESIGFTDYGSHNFKLNPEQEEELKNAIDDGLFHTSKEIVPFIKEKFNVQYTAPGVVKLLHRLGFSYKKTKHKPAKADITKQKQFVTDYQQIRDCIGDNDVLLFLDCCHPTHNSKLGYAWIRKGKEKYVKSTAGRKHANISGAYDIIEHQTTIRFEETINAESIVELVKEIEQKYQDKENILLICDNARYYHAKIVQEYLDKSDKLLMFFTPSYSPNLNLIERLWKLMNEKVLKNQYHEHFSDFLSAIMDFFQTQLGSMKTELQHRMTEQFHLLDST